MPQKAFREMDDDIGFVISPFFKVPSWRDAHSMVPTQAQPTRHCRKAFRGLDTDLEAPWFSANTCSLWIASSGERTSWSTPGRPARKAFRGLDADLGDAGAALPPLCAAVALACAVADLCVLGNILSLLRPLSVLQWPVSLIAEGSYLMLTTAIAYVVDSAALHDMFFTSAAWLLNWSAATGVICSVLKLSMINRFDEYALISPTARGTFESFYGSACCVYLATYFAMALLRNGSFNLDKVAKKMVLYASAGLALGFFSGLFTTNSSLGWLVVLHAMVVAWAVSRCRWHARSSKTPGAL